MIDIKAIKAAAEAATPYPHSSETVIAQGDEVDRLRMKAARKATFEMLKKSFEIERLHTRLGGE